MSVVAASADYAAYTGATAPAGIDTLLRSASRLVGRDTMTAYYDTDSNGNPTDPTILAAMINAACEQVVTWQAAGVDPSAVGLLAKGVVSSKSLDGAAVSYDNSSSTGAAAFAIRQQLVSRLTEQAVAILDEAGLTSTKVWSWG